MDKVTRYFAFFVVILIFLAAIAVIALGVFVPSIAINGKLFDTLGRPVPFVCALYVGVIAALWFLAELLLIMMSVRKGNPFVKRNVFALRRMGIACLIAAFALLFVLFFYGWYHHFSIIVCVFILFFGVLCTFALSGVFMRAVEYKTENDLTV